MKTYIFLIVAGFAILFIHASFIDGEPGNKAELGKLLFFDPILSKDRSISCASCHKPSFAFADTSAVSIGFGGAKGSRNTPSIMNSSLQRFFFWDGRANTLEEQALAPIKNPAEMNLPLTEALVRLKESNMYNIYFKRIFNSEPTRSHLAEALAAFERTQETSDSPFDRWKFSDDTDAVNSSVKGVSSFLMRRLSAINVILGPTSQQMNFGISDYSTVRI